MSDNVTPIKPPPRTDNRERAEQQLSRAIALVDLLQGAACHGAIEPPANEESLARALAVVRDLLEDAHRTLFPEG
jgi:hypothetical protein